MLVEYELAAEDWGAFAQYCAAHSRSFRRTLLRSQIVGALALLFVGVGLFHGSVTQRIVMSVLLAILYWWVISRLAYRRIWQGAVSLERPCNRGRHTVESTAEGIRARCDVTESLHTWAGVRSVASLPAHVFIFIGESLGYAIPRTRVVSGDLDAFVKAAGEHVRVDA